jgi:hypothetical protein
MSCSRQAGIVAVFALAVAGWGASVTAQASTPAGQFTKGYIEFKHGGKLFRVPLQKGRLEATPVNVGKTSTEIRSLTLLYVGEDMDKVSVRIVNLSGPKKYGKKNIGGFWVQTAAGGQSILKSDKGDCSFALSRVGRDRIEGTGSCAPLLDDGRGGTGLPVTELKFSAMP